MCCRVFNPINEKKRKSGDSEIGQKWVVLFSFDRAKIFLTIGTPENSTDLNSLGPQLSIAGLKSAVAYLKDTQLFAQS